MGGKVDWEKECWWRRAAAASCAAGPPVMLGRATAEQCGKGDGQEAAGGAHEARVQPGARLRGASCCPRRAGDATWSGSCYTVPRSPARTDEEASTCRPKIFQQEGCSAARRVQQRGGRGKNTHGGSPCKGQVTVRKRAQGRRRRAGRLNHARARAHCWWGGEPVHLYGHKPGRTHCGGAGKKRQQKGDRRQSGRAHARTVPHEKWWWWVVGRREKAHCGAESETAGTRCVRPPPA